MVIRESIAVLILQENAGHVARSKRIMVAVCSQITAVQGLEILLIGINLLKKIITAHALVTNLAVLHRVVVANHIDVEQVIDLLQRHDGKKKKKI